MKFEKNNKYGKGRPKGSKNKLTKTAKRFLERVITLCEGMAEEDLMKIEPIERLKLAMSSTEYHIPKINRLEIRETINNKITITVKNPPLLEDNNIVHLPSDIQEAEIIKDEVMKPGDPGTSN